MKFKLCSKFEFCLGSMRFCEIGKEYIKVSNFIVVRKISKLINFYDVFCFVFRF